VGHPHRDEATLSLPIGARRSAPDRASCMRAGRLKAQGVRAHCGACALATASRSRRHCKRSWAVSTVELWLARTLVKVAKPASLGHVPRAARVLCSLNGREMRCVSAAVSCCTSTRPGRSHTRRLASCQTPEIVRTRPDTETGPRRSSNHRGTQRSERHVVASREPRGEPAFHIVAVAAGIRREIGVGTSTRGRSMVDCLQQRAGTRRRDLAVHDPLGGRRSSLL
jgi:hypothetical protein